MYFDVVGGQNGFMVAGTVMDENGEPLIGVSVVNQANTSQRNSH